MTGTNKVRQGMYGRVLHAEDKYLSGLRGELFYIQGINTYHRYTDVLVYLNVCLCSTGGIVACGPYYCSKDTPSQIPKTQFDFEELTENQVRQELDPVKYWTAGPIDKKSFLYGTTKASCVASIGSDPEMFVVDAKGEVIPAYTFLPDKATLSKEHGDKFTTLPFWDGFQAEYTTHSHTCLAYLGDEIWEGLFRLHKKAAKVGGRLTNKTVVHVSPAVLAEADPRHIALGCSPSLNAYGHQAPFKASSGSEATVRSAGCHIHIGLVDSYINPVFVQSAVKAVDRIAGVAMTALLDGMEDFERRLWYGLAGEYRLKPYGFEYRVMSSAILSASWLFHLAVDLVRGATNLYGSTEAAGWDCSEEEAVHIINNLDVDAARSVLRRNLTMFANLLQTLYPSICGNSQRYLVELFFRGIANVDPSINDVEENWFSFGWVGHSESRLGQVLHYICAPDAQWEEKLPGDLVAQTFTYVKPVASWAYYEPRKLPAAIHDNEVDEL